jgi:hypothetical protein
MSGELTITVLPPEAEAALARLAAQLEALPELSPEDRARLLVAVRTQVEHQVQAQFRGR